MTPFFPEYYQFTFAHRRLRGARIWAGWSHSAGRGSSAATSPRPISSGASRMFIYHRCRRRTLGPMVSHSSILGTDSTQRGTSAMLVLRGTIQSGDTLGVSTTRLARVTSYYYHFPTSGNDMLPSERDDDASPRKIPLRRKGSGRQAQASPWCPFSPSKLERALQRHRPGGPGSARGTKSPHTTQRPDIPQRPCSTHRRLIPRLHPTCCGSNLVLQVLPPSSLALEAKQLLSLIFFGS